MIPRSLSSILCLALLLVVRRSLSRIVVGRRAESVIITDNFIASDGSRGQAVHHMRKANGPGCDLFDPTDPNRGHSSGNPRTASNPTGLCQDGPRYIPHGARHIPSGLVVSTALSR